MALWVREDHVNATKGYRMGDFEPYESSFEDDEIGALYRATRREYGRCTGRVYIDAESGPKAVGWVFVKRERYEDAPDKTFLHETWVTVHKGPPTRTVEYDYVAFGKHP